MSELGRGESLKKTGFAVRCSGGCNDRKLIFLTEEEYTRQMRASNSRWACPRCGALASWSDENYEKYLEPLGEDYEDDGGPAPEFMDIDGDGFAGGDDDL